MTRFTRVRLAAERWVLIGLLIVVAGLVVNLLRLQAGVASVSFGAAAQRQPFRQLAHVPVTVVVRETTVDPKGVERGGGLYTLAIRSDGSYARRTELITNRTLHEQKIERFIQSADGLRVETDDLRRLRSSTQWSFEPLPVRTPASGCRLAYEDAGFDDGEISSDHNESVLGYRVLRLSRSDGSLAWHAPDLGCARVKSKVTVRGSTNIKMATAIFTDEPNPSLFGSAEHEEVPPSVRLGVVDPSEKLRLDKVYFARRPASLGADPPSRK